MTTETEGKAPHAESSRSKLPSLYGRFCDQFLRLFDSQITLFKAELKGAVKIYSKHLFLTVSSALVACLGFSFVSIGLVLWVDGTSIIWRCHSVVWEVPTCPSVSSPHGLQ